MSYETLVYNRAAIGGNYSGGVFTPATDVTSTNWVIRNDTENDMNVGDTVNVYDDDNGNLIYSNATYVGYFQFGSAQRPFVQLNNGDYALFGRPGFGTYNITAADFTQGSIVCFCAGTLISTTQGEVPVEQLTTDDILVTADGETRPVKWIGRQTVAAAFADPVRCYPVRIQAGALAEGVPARDLFLSPDHALLVDGFLVQAGALVNGITVARIAEPDERFTYYHVETEDHAIILAEGTPAETFVSNVTRCGFDNYDEYVALFGERADFEAMVERDEPRAMSARQVPAVVRVRLDERAGALLPADRAAA